MGTCGAQLKRWTYMKLWGCYYFYFGGCQGNKNNFLTKEDCLTSCSNRQKSSPLESSLRSSRKRKRGMRGKRKRSKRGKREESKRRKRNRSKRKRKRKRTKSKRKKAWDGGTIIYSNY